MKAFLNTLLKQMLLEPYMFTTSERDIIDNFHTIKKNLIFWSY